VRLAVWSPLPPSTSGIADYVAEGLPVLARSFQVVGVVPDPASVDRELAARVALCTPAEATADLDVYHLGNSPPHGYVYRAALARPGVVFLHEANLHHLVLSQTVEAGDVSAYLRLMRQEHGEEGSFVARQIARGLGGEMLPAIYSLGETVLRANLAMVGLTRQVCGWAGNVMAPRPAYHLRHHLWLPPHPPSLAEARQRLGLAKDALVVTLPGLATAHKGVEVAIRAVARLRRERPETLLVLAGGEDPHLPIDAWLEAGGLRSSCVRPGRLSMDGFLAYIAASDVVLALRFPSYGEMSGALVRTLGLGKAAIVTAGTAGGEEFPAGCVFPVTPGAREEEALLEALRALGCDGNLRQRMGAAASAWVRREHAIEACTSGLAGFLGEVVGRAQTLGRQVEPAEDALGLMEYLVGEARWHARDLGLRALPLRAWLGDLAGEQR
jgi:glycosyltransferase involved in cell wall biosynthesis